MLQERWERALTFDAFLKTARSHSELWAALYRHARIPTDLLERARALRRRWHLLVLSEDWCGDAVNTVPIVARLAADTPGIDLRLLARDENPDLMNLHLTGTSRSIPVVMALGHDFVEHGWWGPRPAQLQAWFLAVGRGMEKSARYKELRTWYARDRGASTAREIVEMLERAEE